MTWLPTTVTFAGVAGFILAGAAVGSLLLQNDRSARACARGAAGLGASGAALSALWLSAMVLWPLEAARAQGVSASNHMLRPPLEVLLVCSAFAFVDLPIALVVLRITRRRRGWVR